MIRSPGGHEMPADSALLPPRTHPPRPCGQACSPMSRPAPILLSALLLGLHWPAAAAPPMAPSTAAARAETASPQQPPARVPPPARLVFAVEGSVKGLPYRTDAELVWTHHGGRYEARQEIRAFLVGSRTQTSQGRVTAHGLQPERFGDRSRRERTAWLDFERGEARFSAGAPPAPIEQGAQDRLSVFLQLGALIAAAPQDHPAGTRIELQTVGIKGADRWSFTVQGLETLDLPLGPTPALRLQRLPARPDQGEQTAELWLGTRLDYLPVRIRIAQDGGDRIDLQLQERSSP